ncbi:3-coathanger stack domain-containing protein [Larkinella arboricola]|nr:3-coathanger stack domain-containing protein [Larkinella arboricola]
MKTIAMLLAFTGLMTLTAAHTNANDHLKLNSTVNAKEVKTEQAQRSIVLLPGFAVQSGAVFQASVGDASLKSVVTIGKYGEELVRPIRIEPAAEPSETNAKTSVNQP